MFVGWEIVTIKVHLGEVCLKSVFILKDLLKRVIFPAGGGIWDGGLRLRLSYSQLTPASLQLPHPWEEAGA